MNNNLRLILLIIGCCLVLGIYLWEIFRKRQRRNKADILNAVDEIPDKVLSPLTHKTTSAWPELIAIAAAAVIQTAVAPPIAPDSKYFGFIPI